MPCARTPYEGGVRVPFCADSAFSGDGLFAAAQWTFFPPWPTHGKTADKIR
jgi:hypothetical protein